MIQSLKKVANKIIFIIGDNKKFKTTELKNIKIECGNNCELSLNYCCINDTKIFVKARDDNKIKTGNYVIMEINNKNKIECGSNCKITMANFNEIIDCGHEVKIVGEKWNEVYKTIYEMDDFYNSGGCEFKLKEGSIIELGGHVIKFQ